MMLPLLRAGVPVVLRRRGYGLEPVVYDGRGDFIREMRRPTAEETALAWPPPPRAARLLTAVHDTWMRTWTLGNTHDDGTTWVVPVFERVWT